MKNRELFLVSSDIASMPPDEVATPAVLGRLAHSLCRHTPLHRVDLLCAPLKDGSEGPDPYAELIVGTTLQPGAIEVVSIPVEIA